ncbi:hypothetical protein P3T76_008020 [Phytophthora citrophthora]|uniref:No apical meristem-associated C-terminal domain-containing protein n=1 Tax=Phytophthora citrophthora TaxID=4793 RepID=A0AAD9LMS4_9STRA|nr:hypothetical protein P3T76_008020 [Phytophthora citrophthora]
MVLQQPPSMARKGSKSCDVNARKSLPKEFNANEQEWLSRAWIKVANETVQHDVDLTKAVIADYTQEMSKSFWELVEKEYANIAPKKRFREAEALFSQWDAMLPDLTDFLGAFMHVQEGVDERTGQDAENNREMVLTSVRKAFYEKHDYEFQYEVTTRLLVLHGHWRDVLKPLLIPDDEGRDEEEDGRDETTAEDPESSNDSTEKSESEEFTPRNDESESDSSSDCQMYESVEALKAKEADKGVTRPRSEQSSENEDDSTDRQRRQRLNAVGDAIFRSEMQFSEAISAKQVEVMERQLDWEIMTRSGEGLSDEAAEYIRLQRAQILQKIRKQSEEVQD